MNKKGIAFIISLIAALFLWTVFPTLGDSFDAAMFTLIGAIGMSVLALILLIMTALENSAASRREQQPYEAAAPNHKPTDGCRRFATAMGIAIAICVGLALLNHATDTGFMAGVLGDIILAVVFWVLVPVLAVDLIVWAARAVHNKKQIPQNKEDIS